MTNGVCLISRIQAVRKTIIQIFKTFGLSLIMNNDPIKSQFLYVSRQLISIFATQPSPCNNNYNEDNFRRISGMSS